MKFTLSPIIGRIIQLARQLALALAVTLCKGYKTMKSANYLRLFLTLSMAVLLAVPFNPVSNHASAQSGGCSGCVMPTFEVGGSYYVDGSPEQIAVDDFNRDGKPDMAVAVGSSVAVFLGDGTGSFGSPRLLQTSYSSSSSAVGTGDFNGDGNPDIVSAGITDWGEVYLGDGTGGFTGPTPFQISMLGNHECHEIVIGDFNRDSKTDIALALRLAGLTILFGDGAGNFSPPVELLGSYGPFQVSAADFNNDGNTDLITQDESGPEGTGNPILLSDGVGGFVVRFLSVAGNGFGIADFNGDTKVDLVLASCDGVMLYPGDGSGGFGTSQHCFPINGGENSFIRAADFNGDGKPDVAVLQNGWPSNDVVILVGDGAGSFSSPATFALGDSPQKLAVADLNLDGKPDIISSSAFDQKVTVLLNTTYQTPVGENATVAVGQQTFTFDNVTAGGTTTVAPIDDPATAGEVPGGFAVSSLAAYEIHTTATFTGSIVAGFQVPFTDADHNGIDDATGSAFADMRILHREQTGVDTSGNPVYSLVDRTILPPNTPAPDSATHTIYARVSSFSPFFLARVGNKIRPLFDRSRAYRAGSTVPVKVQLQNAAGANISSSATVLTARSLKLIGGNTTSSVIDSGNANPDANFRYDSSLGGYIFNLSTRGLAAGRYVLSFYAGSDHSFFYTVEFEVR